MTRCRTGDHQCDTHLISALPGGGSFILRRCAAAHPVPSPSRTAVSGPGAQMLKMGGPMQQARNFAVMTGVNAGVQTLMRRVRKVDDIQNSLVAAFTSGACFSLVSGQGNAAPAVAGATPNPLVGAVTAGVMFALFQGAFYKLGEKFSGPKPDPNTEYDRVKAMLANLGLTVSTKKK